MVDPKAADIPYEPAVLNRETKRALVAQIPGSEKARVEAAAECLLLRQLLEARKRAALTQEEVAARGGPSAFSHGGDGLSIVRRSGMPVPCHARGG